MAIIDYPFVWPFTRITLQPLGTAIYSTSASLTGSYTFDGTTTPTDQTGPWNMTSTDSTYGILRFVLDTPVKFSDITDVNVGYDSNLGGIGGGSPRLAVVFSTGDYLYINWGPAGSFVDTTIGNNLNTGNLIGMNDLGRYDNSGVGGGFYSDYASALALAGSKNVVRFSVVIDSYGGNDRNFDINSITVDSVAPVPEPTTMIAGALLLLPFGASALRSLRKRQTA
jgi:hypothetical protein